jgi:ABC-type multidrug transport system ATPase subunit
MKIELRHAAKTYRKLRALDDLSLVIEPGQIVAVLGPNGAGKTTLLRSLAGIVALDRGQILYDDLPFDRSQVSQRRRFFYLPDFPLVFEEMSVLRHIGVTLRLYGAEGDGAEDRVMRWLSEFDLLPLAEQPFVQLSRGQRYKAALAMFLSANTELWMLDEPFASGMDPQGIRVFKAAGREAASLGGTVIFTTQILEVAERFADRVCVIHNGRLKAFESIATLRSGYEVDGGSLEKLFENLRSNEEL